MVGAGASLMSGAAASLGLTQKVHRVRRISTPSLEDSGLRSM